MWIFRYLLMLVTVIDGKKLLGVVISGYIFHIYDAAPFQKKNSEKNSESLKKRSNKKFKKKKFKKKVQKKKVQT